MSDKTDKELQQDAEKQQIAELMQYAIAIGMKRGTDFSPNTGLEKLEQRIAEFEAKLAEEHKSVLETKQEELRLKASRPLPDDLELTAPPGETEVQRKIRMHKNANRLVRVKVTCMNPDKSKWKGEVFAVGNSTIGSIKKFVPFSSKLPYHVPVAILKMMKDRTYTQHYTVKDQYNRPINKTRQANEFAIETFGQMTEAEFNKIAQKQAADKALETED